jgi:hypothetical protein
MQREFAQRDILAGIIRWGIENGEFRAVHPEEFAHTIIMLAHMWGLKGWSLISMMSLDQFIEHQLELIFSRLDHSSQSGGAEVLAARNAGAPPEDTGRSLRPVRDESSVMAAK